MRPDRIGWSAAAVACSALACQGPVESGYPPLVNGCQTDSQCNFAGPGFACVDGGCAERACLCDGDCAPGQGCLFVGGTVGECIAEAPLQPCSDAGLDGGLEDGGPADGGRDGGSIDGGPADAGPDAGPDAGAPDAGEVDAGKRKDGG